MGKDGTIIQPESPDIYCRVPNSKRGQKERKARERERELTYPINLHKSTPHPYHWFILSYFIGRKMVRTGKKLHGRSQVCFL